MLTSWREAQSFQTYLGITSADRILAVLPFSFDAGMNQLMTAFQQGGTIVLINFVFAREVVQMLLKERITRPCRSTHAWSFTRAAPFHAAKAAVA